MSSSVSGTTTLAAAQQASMATTNAAAALRGKRTVAAAGVASAGAPDDRRDYFRGPWDVTVAPSLQVWCMIVSLQLGVPAHFLLEGTG